MPKINYDQKYKTKAKDSFKTKKTLFLFDLAIHGRTNFTAEEFDDFQIKNELVIEYTAEYWQQHKGYKIRKSTINECTIQSIENRIIELEKSSVEQLKQLEARYISNFEKVFPKAQFEEIMAKENCCYCGITIEELEIMADKKKLFKKNLRGWTLEVERFNSNLEYTPANCDMACYWCNNAKTDEFSKEEFIQIAVGIKQVWENRKHDHR